MFDSYQHADWSKQKPSYIQSNMRRMKSELVGLYIARDGIQSEISDREWQMTLMAEALVEKGWTYSPSDQEGSSHV